jgi:LysR family transcriptional regulator (chromosome initiation inhibitor)
VRLLDPAGLECLAALTEGGGFEKAADLLNITQSAVSQRLRSMESDVGRLLVVRSRPLRLTESGKVLLRYARQIQALGADAARELGAESGLDDRIPIAINADSLATWVLPALDPVVQAGQRDGYGLELVVDDQDFTHDWLRQGDVLGCVSTLARRSCNSCPHRIDSRSGAGRNFVSCTHASSHTPNSPSDGSVADMHTICSEARSQFTSPRW